MNPKIHPAIKASKMQPLSSIPMRWAGLSSMVAGLCIIIVGTFHPMNTLTSVTSTTWASVHVFEFALGFFGLFGMAGLYTRQMAKSGWMGLAGFVLFSIWMMLDSGFAFVEALVLPHLVGEAPEFVTGFLGIFTGVPSQVNLGILPILRTVSNPMYLFGPLLFGLATFRAGIFPRWAGALLVLGAMLAPVSALAIPSEYQPKVMIPIGLALAWMGYAIFSERRSHTLAPLPNQKTVTLDSNSAV